MFCGSGDSVLRTDAVAARGDKYVGQDLELSSEHLSCLEARQVMHSLG